MIGSSLQRARAAVKKARDEEARWAAEAAAAAAEFTDLEGRAGAEVLAAQDGAAAAVKLGEQMDRLRSRQSIARRTADAAKVRVDLLEREALSAEADELEEQATAIDRDADKREQRTQDLLRQLRDHEGVRFAPAALPSTDGVFRQPLTPRTRTEEMHGRATGLRRQAALLRATAKSGTVPTFVPDEPGVQTAPLLTDSLRSFRANRETVAVA